MAHRGHWVGIRQGRYDVPVRATLATPEPPNPKVVGSTPSPARCREANPTPPVAVSRRPRISRPILCAQAGALQPSAARYDTLSCSGYRLMRERAFPARYYCWAAAGSRTVHKDSLSIWCMGWTGIVIGPSSCWHPMAPRSRTCARVGLRCISFPCVRGEAFLGACAASGMPRESSGWRDTGT